MKSRHTKTTTALTTNRTTVRYYEHCSLEGSAHRTVLRNVACGAGGTPSDKNTKTHTKNTTHVGRFTIEII